MTNDEKAKAYDEALKQARFYHGNCPSEPERKKLEEMFPVLRESEDERIRQKLMWLLQQDICPFPEEEVTQMLNYLEKQKYDRMKPIYDARESFESALEKAWNDYHNGYENVDKLEDDYVECAHAKGFREGYLFGIEKQKEQKPAEWSEKDKEMLMRCIAAIPVQGDEIMPTSYLNKLRNWLEFLPERFNLPPKQEWSEEDEKLLNYAISMTDDAQVERFLKSLRPPKDCSNDCPKHLQGYIDGRGDAEKKLLDEYGILIMPEGELHMKARWKPSEEQMEALMLAIEGKCPPTSYMSRRLEDLYEQLKKL